MPDTPFLLLNPLLEGFKDIPLNLPCPPYFVLQTNLRTSRPLLRTCFNFYYWEPPQTPEQSETQLTGG